MYKGTLAVFNTNRKSAEGKLLVGLEQMSKVVIQCIPPDSELCIKMYTPWFFTGLCHSTEPSKTQ
jgi:hypothetical protein